MDKEFVPYNLSLRIKQLGFDEPCFAHWFNNVGIGIEFRLEPLNKAIAKTNISVYYELAPLYQQAFRWFREKYNILSRIDRMRPSNRHFFEWRESDNKLQTGEMFFDTYEEAELACLEKLIEIVEHSKSE